MSLDRAGSWAAIQSNRAAGLLRVTPLLEDVFFFSRSTPWLHKDNVGINLWADIRGPIDFGNKLQNVHHVPSNRPLQIAGHFEHGQVHGNDQAANYDA